MDEYMLLDTVVYKIDDDKNLHNILAYSIRRKKSGPPILQTYTFQTKKRLPKILRGYKNTERKAGDYYPRAFIIPSPTYRKYKNPIPFDGKFALVVGHAKETPPPMRLDKLIIASGITIYGEKSKPEKMYVDGICGSEYLTGSRKTKRYIIYLQKANLDDIVAFIRSYNLNSQIIGENEMVKSGYYIFTEMDVCDKRALTPKDIKIFEIYR
ncbi:MAG: hypothetical protein RXQ77_01000 [Candidatus Nanopusillus sp.]